MKKVLKILVVILLVLMVIVGTVFLFMQRVNADKNTTTSMASILYSESKKELDKMLDSTAEQIKNSDSTDTRLNLICETNVKLNDILKSLLTYYVSSNTQISDDLVYNQLPIVVSSRNKLIKMLNEYNIKKDSEYFNLHIGANDLFIQSLDYLKKYADLNDYIANTITVNKVSDLKFNMFDIYFNVVNRTFNENNLDLGKVTTLKKCDNLIKINSLLNINGSHIVKVGGGLIATDSLLTNRYNNLFNEYYNSCNKLLFADNLCDNLNDSNINSANQATNEKKAIFYLKQIYGI